MKKIINKIRKIFTMVGGFLMLGISKVLGAVESDWTTPLYGPPPQDLYGPPPTPVPYRVGGIIRGIFIPLVFIIGSIIYLVKSKSSKTKKVITIAIAALICILVYILVGKIMNDYI